MEIGGSECGEEGEEGPRLPDQEARPLSRVRGGTVTAHQVLTALSICTFSQTGNPRRPRRHPHPAAPPPEGEAHEGRDLQHLVEGCGVPLPRAPLQGFPGTRKVKIK